MYTPGNRSINEELSAIGSAIAIGESDKLYKFARPIWVYGGSAVQAAVTGSIYSWSFSDATTHDLRFILPLELGWSESGILIPQVRWAPGNANSGNVDWKLDWTAAAPDTAFPSGTTISVSAAAAGTAKQLTLSEFPDVDITGLPIRSELVCRLYRDGSADSYSGAAYMFDFGFILQVNSTGSVYPDARVFEG